ncbi:MAG: hypothetical protein GY754_43065, partial [bacterium]|nr:hypothetical protein [bacterium]
NGLHHRMIEKVIEMMESKQSFIANQNPILFDYMEFNTQKDVQESLTLCELEEGGMIWRDPTEKEAAEFFKEVEKDFLHVSEILRNKELW